jgi:hypothetical protein
MAAIVLPPQSYIRFSPDYAWNGFCRTCDDVIYGSSFICRHGEFCLDCAVALNFLCNNCQNDTADCACPDITTFYVPVNIKEAA